MVVLKLEYLKLNKIYRNLKFLLIIMQIGKVLKLFSYQLIDLIFKLGRLQLLVQSPRILFN